MLQCGDTCSNNTSPLSDETSVFEDNSRRIYQCIRCQKSFVSKYLSDEHLRSVHEKRRFLCTQCPETFAYRSGRTRHIQSQHQKYRYVCKLCCAFYTSRETAQSHVRQKHRAVADVIEKNAFNQPKRASSIDDYVVKRPFNISEIRRIGKPKSADGLESTKFENSSILSEIDVMSENLNFCENKAILASPEDSTRINTSYNQSVQNDLCGNMVSDDGNDLPPFIPPPTNESKELIANDLDDQLKINGDRNPVATANAKSRWKCSFCEKTFAYNAGRSKHIRSVHRKIRYRCDVCTCLYTSKDYASQHLSSAHSIKEGSISFITQIIAPRKDDSNFDQFSDLNDDHLHPNLNNPASEDEHCEELKSIKSEDLNFADNIGDTNRNSLGSRHTIASNNHEACKSDDNDFRLPINFQETRLPLSFLLSVSQFWPLAVNYDETTTPAVLNLPFHCLQCGIGFPTQDLLAQHVDRSHSILTSDSSPKGSLEDDLMALICGVHEPRMLRCLYCGVTVLRPASLIGHMKSRHADMSYACAICRHIFQCPTLASYHIEKEHHCDPARVLLHVPSSVAQMSETRII
uniref:C2H2-type domain-containing protein n=1 Tax=Romanomermis culicivorax TaxID=13658 RepID=A0A915HNS8_ROMCU